MDATDKPAFFDTLSEIDQQQLARFIDGHIRDSLRSNALLSRLATESSRSELVIETLAGITSKTGLSPDEVLVLALTLYDVAVDAVQRGERLVLLDSDYRYVREVTGLGLNEADAPVHETVAG